jgi:hypothetical protein
MSTPRVTKSATSAQHDIPTMPLPSPSIGHSHYSGIKPKPMRMSRKQRAKERNQTKKALKKEAAKHVGRTDRHKEKFARRRTAKKARKAVKNETSIQQQVGGIIGNVKTVAINNIPSPQSTTAGDTFLGGTPEPKDAIVTSSATLSNKELLRAVIQKVDCKEANGLPRSTRRIEIIRKLTEHKNRQKSETVVRQAHEQNAGRSDHEAATATVTQKPLSHFSPPNPRTSIVNRHRSAAPSSGSTSKYTIATAKLLLTTETERRLFNSFLHARSSCREAETAQALAHKSSIDLTQDDESNHEGNEELESSQPFNPTHYPTDLINSFSTEGRKPGIDTLSVNNRAEVDHEDDNDDMSSIEDISPTTKTRELYEDDYQVDSEKTGNKALAGKDMVMSGNDETEQEGHNPEAAIPAYGESTTNSAFFDLTQDDSNISETKVEEVKVAVTSSTLPQTRISPIDLTRDDSDEFESKTKIEQAIEATDVPALATAANNPVHIILDECNTAAQASDAARERRLDRSIDRELERTAQEATQRPVNALEQLLARDHAMLFLGQLDTHDAVLHASFEFVRGLRAEHSVLNSECQRYDLELGMLRFRLAQSEDNQDKTRRVEQMKIWSEELGVWLLIVENEFRALVAKGEFELKWVLKSAVKAVKTAIERYDRLMASLFGPFRAS